MEVLSDIIAEITITNETITVRLVLKSLLYGMDGRGDDSRILEIPGGSHNAVAMGCQGVNVELSSNKLFETSRRKSNSRAG